jgi:hypothetical protein
MILKSGQYNQKKYLSSSDPLSPCNKDFIPDQAKMQCYTYLTPHLYTVTGGNLVDPSDDSLRKAFLLCDTIAQNQPGSRYACFGGFGKEFIGLVTQKDIRNIGRHLKRTVAKIYALCSLAPHEEAFTDCIQNTINSLYWGGENNPSAAIRFCDIASKKWR